MPREVTNSDDTLVEAISAGRYEKPELMEWNDWQKWRKPSRPTARVDGARRSTKDEMELYKATMEHYYGADWKQDLETKMVFAAEAKEAEERAAEGPRGLLGRLAATP